ncbi:MAG: SDR family NAD(P)-dependent oxidoreductase [Streptosporangiaceae bacterium]
MDLQLAGKRAIVTGGSRGIGFAIATALAAEGAAVALLARDPDRLAGAARELRRAGRRVLALPADTTDDAAVRAAADRTAAELGGVDILVNNAADPAGPGTPRALADLVDADLLAALDAKVLGYLRCARAAAPYMIAQGWGRIINIGGLAARGTGLPSGSVRNIGVAALAKNLADELGPAGINVTVVHPGMTITERPPARTAGWPAARASIGRVVTAAEVADVVTFLASPRSVAINGDPIAAGGGTPGVIYY